MFEEELNETQFQRSKLEFKVKAMKQKKMTDEVTLESDLKSELENKKLHLEQLQEQVLSIKQLVKNEKQRSSKQNEDRTTGKALGSGLNEIRSIVQDLSAGIPLGTRENEEASEQHLNDLKRAIPTEIARITTRISKLGKELQQLEECRLDIAENLFQGLEPDDITGDLSKDQKANVRNLHAWRRLNEFRSDIKGEKKSIENEALRVESQINRLKESKQWLTDMSIKINQIQVNSGTVLERTRLVQEFKGYLRKKIGIERVEKAEDDGRNRMGTDHSGRNIYEE